MFTYRWTLHGQKLGCPDTVDTGHQWIDAFGVGTSLQDYKALCAAVAICAALVDPKFDVYIVTPVTLKSRSNQRLSCHLVR